MSIIWAQRTNCTAERLLGTDIGPLGGPRLGTIISSYVITSCHDLVLLMVYKTGRLMVPPAGPSKVWNMLWFKNRDAF